MTTKEMIEMMQAFERGEEIEVSCVDDYNWVHVMLPSWNWKEYKYRIKPIFKEEKIEPKFKKGDTIIQKNFAMENQSIKIILFLWWKI